MSQNINLPDNAFDDGFDPTNPGEAHDEAVAFIRYAKMCFLAGLSVEKAFEAGVSLILPGITRTKYEAGHSPTSTGEPFSFPILKIKPGSKDKLYTIIMREVNRDGQEFDNVFRFKNYNEAVQTKEVDANGQPIKNEKGKDKYSKVKGEDGKYVNERNAFYDFQAPELAKLKASNPAGYAKLEMTGRALFSGDQEKAWVYVKAFVDDTGYDKGNEVRQYLKDITIFSSKEEWEKAKKETGQPSNGVSYDHYPRVWGSDPARLREFVTTANAAGKPHAVIAKEGLLEGEAINGQPVNVKALLAEILDIPENMVTL